MMTHQNIKIYNNYSFDSWSNNKSKIDIIFENQDKKFKNESNALKKRADERISEMSKRNFDRKKNLR